MSSVALLILLASLVAILVVLLWALGDPFRQLAAGILLRADKRIRVGVWIQLDGETAGQVVRLGWRATTLLTAEGQELLVPNRRLTEGAIRRFVRGEPGAWRRIDVTCPGDVPPARVQQTLLDCLKQCEGVEQQPSPTVWNQGFGERGIEYALRFRVREEEPAESVESTVRNRLWYALHRQGIALAPAVGPVHPFQESAQEKQRRQVEETARRQERLARVDLFAALPNETLADLARTARIEHYTSGENIVRQGEEGNELFILHTGLVLVRALDSGGREREVQRLGAGQFFGEMSLLTGERRSATVRATQDCELIVLSRAGFAAVLEKTPALVASIQQTLEARQQELQSQLDQYQSVLSSEDSLVGRFLKNFHLR